MMNYHLAKNTELIEILPLRCSYMAGPDLQLAVLGIGLGSAGSKQIQFLNYVAPLASPEIESLVHRFIPEIDFASLQLILSHSRLSTLLRGEVLLNTYHIPNSPHVFKILEQSVDWSDSVLTWLLQKKIKPHELAFLNLLTKDETGNLLSRAAQSILSKTDILRLLEIVSELILMKTDVSTILTNPWTEKTMTLLSALRFPLSTTKNPVNEVQLHWPKSVTTQTKRIHDKMGFQVQFFVSHPDELNHTLSQLQKIIPEWFNKVQGLQL